ncbi:adenylate/guanylate cyclase domain-containing protein [Bradyrhizobium sp.]|uniref:adenylate/guanylate cyclase domain-containing protein n=1 Tax=Bradyrhizobium sp. TaxID=376 RepID=UPI0025B9E0B4|nr:adenylate/guanylate cyclase domain-containing protein [Bradyrhizobium sp.]
MTQNCQNSPTVRRLAAIMFADIVGFSRLMERNEALTFSRLRRLREEVNLLKVEEYGGRVIRTTGDGFLAEFGSAVAAVQCGFDIQRTVMELEQGQPLSERIRFRIGINVGDIIVDGDDIAGDGVNIAARLEALAPVDGICVSSAVREQIRDDFGFTDMGEQKLKNIARPIRTYAWRPDAAITMPALTPAPDRPVAKPARLSIVVLPFTNVSGDPAQEYFSDGITDEVTAQLSKIRGSYVIGRDTAFRYKGKEVDIRSLGVELGVRYVLKGSVERFDQGIDTTAQLWDALAGTVLWADTMEVDKTAVRNIRREVVNRLAIALNLQLIEAEARHSEGSENPDATDLVMQARAAYYRANTLDALQQVRVMFEKALSINGDEQAALVGRAVTMVEQVFGWPSDANARLIDEADALMAKAMPLDRHNAYARFVMSRLRQMQCRIEAALAENQIALELDPNLVEAIAWNGNLQFASGRPELGIEPLRRALAQSPRDRMRWVWCLMLGLNYSLMGQYHDAIIWLERSIAINPRHWANLAFAVVAYANVGDRANAMRARAQFDEVYRGEIIEPRFYSQTPAFLELLDARVMPAWRQMELPEPDSPTSFRRLGMSRAASER